MYYQDDSMAIAEARDGGQFVVVLNVDGARFMMGIYDSIDEADIAKGEAEEFGEASVEYPGTCTGYGSESLATMYNGEEVFGVY